MRTLYGNGTGVEVSLEDDIVDELTKMARYLDDEASVVVHDCIRVVTWHFARQESEESNECICIQFGDTGGVYISDLACPVHGVNGTNPCSTWSANDVLA